MGLQSGAVSNQHALNRLQPSNGQGEVSGCSTCTFWLQHMHFLGHAVPSC